MEEMIKLKIDGMEIEVPEGTTVLAAAKKLGIDIPTLCYLKDVNDIGACRMCVVEVFENDRPYRNLPTSCTLKVKEGMDVKTNTKKVMDSRKTNLELILSNHNQDCLSCVASGECKLQKLSEQLGADSHKYEGEKLESDEDISSLSIVRDSSKCILCRRCVSICTNVQNVGALGISERGFKTNVSPALTDKMSHSNCINCGQCVKVCPTGALTIKSDIDRVFDAIADESKLVLVQTAPSVRVGLAEEFGMPIGTIATGQMVESLRRLGFDKVFDTNFAADLTIIEEAYEFVDRVKDGGVLPMFTSCCPGWVSHVEKEYPDLIPNLSSCKSPQAMLGGVIKKFYKKMVNIGDKEIVLVSLMPCTAKKYEIKRDDLVDEVDIVITTREAAKMIKRLGIDFNNLNESEFDSAMGESTGAGTIFGATGGVMEAALRTVSESVLGKTLDSVDYSDVRGLDGIKEATLDLNDLEVTVAVVNGLGNVEDMVKLLNNKQYHFIEVMACPGGCINGGGQPITEDVLAKEKRTESIYKIDKDKKYRKSHENPEIKDLYAKYLGTPNHGVAHEILHTVYGKEEKYKS